MSDPDHYEEEAPIRYMCPTVTKFYTTHIRSSRDSNKSYMVTHSDGEWACTCPGYRYGFVCRHIKEAMSDHCGKHWEALIGKGPTEPGLCECGETLVQVLIDPEGYLQLDELY